MLFRSGIIKGGGAELFKIACRALLNVARQHQHIGLLGMDRRNGRSIRFESSGPESQLDLVPLSFLRGVPTVGEKAHGAWIFHLLVNEKESFVIGRIVEQLILLLRFPAEESVRFSGHVDRGFRGDHGRADHTRFPESMKRVDVPLDAQISRLIQKKPSRIAVLAGILIVSVPRESVPVVVVGICHHRIKELFLIVDALNGIYSGFYP